MDDPSVVSLLEQRVVALESAYRRTRFAAVIFGAIVAVTILTAQSSNSPMMIGDPQGAHTEIAQNGVNVFDAQGKLRLEMNIGSNGVPGFVVFADGKNVAEMNGGQRGGFVRFYSNDGTDAAYAGVYSDGTSGLDVEDTQGKTRLAISADKDGSAGYYIDNPDAKTIVSLVGTGGNGFLRLRDKNLIERTYLGVAGDGTSELSILDGKGTVRTYLGLYTDGSSGVSAYNSSGTAVWSSPSAR